MLQSSLIAHQTTRFRLLILNSDCTVSSSSSFLSYFLTLSKHPPRHTTLLNDSSSFPLLWTLYQPTIQQSTTNCPTSSSHVKLSTNKRREASGKWSTLVPFIHGQAHWLWYNSFMHTTSKWHTGISTLHDPEYLTWLAEPNGRRRRMHVMCCIEINPSYCVG